MLILLLVLNLQQAIFIKGSLVFFYFQKDKIIIVPFRIVSFFIQRDWNYANRFIS
jgi:hypothetical protein